MGASNFRLDNASTYFVVLDGEVEQWEIEDFKEYAQEILGEIGYDVTDGTDNSRNYTGIYLASNDFTRYFGETEIGFQLIAKYNCGYYEGANLDFRIECAITGDEYDSISDLMEDIYDKFESDYFPNVGISKILTAHAEKWMEASYEKAVKELEEKFTQISTPYNITAKFSNGETIYQKA